MANNSVYGIASDSRGFLWFATDEGLSRFDGFSFSDQSTNSKVPRATLRQVLIGRTGIFWFATPAGVIRFRPDLPPANRDRTLVIRPDGGPDAASVFSLLEDRRGRIWCVTRGGVFVIDGASEPSPRMVEAVLGLPADDCKATALAEDAEGALWIGTNKGTLFRRLADGMIERHATTEAPSHSSVTRLFIDHQGLIWVGRLGGLDRSKPALHPGAEGFERLSRSTAGAPFARVFDILQSRDGDIWVGMYRYLLQFPADRSGVRVWNKDNGIPSRGIGTLAQDRDGNIWLGTGDQGAYKLSAGSMLTFSNEDGVGADAVISIAETRRGELYFGGRLEWGGFRIAVRAGNGFRAIAPRTPPSVHYLGWRPSRMILQDHAGEWWLATGEGLCRYPRLENPLQLAQTLPTAIYTVRDGLPGDIVTRLFEDREGNIWIGTETTKFVYWSRTDQHFVAVPHDGESSFAASFAQDQAGRVWIGDEEGGLWRVSGGRASLVSIPAKRATLDSLLVDHAGRLWIATDGQGLIRIDQFAAAIPQYRLYGYAEGLSSLAVHSLTEDRNGSIYLGTGGGVDQLDPDLTHIRHYTSADGVAAGEVNDAFCDRSGMLWFGTNHGLTRLIPRNRTSLDAPPIWITGVSIAGLPAPVSEAGESNVGELQVKAGQEHIQFDFVGLSYASGNVLRYQYRLGDGAWGAPIESHSVHYGALAPGAYRFSVRAVNSDGAASPAPATVQFHVAWPIWRRAWFQGLLIVLCVTGVATAHRVRSTRLLELERVRSSIALDLHDDIASNLAQITIFSEIAMREAGPGSSAGEPLARIAETARETVECISDIVWSIRPQKEGDLVQRIRRFGSDALTSRQIDVHFHFADEVRRLPLDPNTRRQVYLIYKEAVHNIVRHAHASAVEIAMNVDGLDILLQVSDNGAGFESPEEGNGLPGMRARAASLGGTLSLCSAAGKGTKLELRTPWRPRRRYRTLPGSVGSARG